MAGSKQKIIETLQSVDTVLVTVGRNPSVDELSAALGLTIYLNEAGKHATAVMSGDIPPAISFLEPEKTFENSVDSLRDFVIALDKDKADHLRYKLVDDVVKIFITPYRSVITEKDLKYSKGDYNVELVIAIGVKTRDDLDKALTSHGRILHDATVATIGQSQSKLGEPDWYDRDASSLSEMVTSIVAALSEDKKMDKRVASSLLTGIVSATDRFSNDSTTPGSLNVAAELMSFGANQQLIALKLREGSKIDIKPEDGSKRLHGDFNKDEKGDRNQKDSQSKKSKKKNKEKDTTKFSISHSGNDRKPNKDNSQDKSQKPKEDKPQETIAPNRIGLGEDGEYDPAAALDEALRISEKKRAVDSQDDKDQLAEELAKTIGQSSNLQPQEDTKPPVEQSKSEPVDNVETPAPTAPIQQPSQEVESNRNEQTASQAPQEPNHTPSPSNELPPVQPDNQIDSVRQTNLPPVDSVDSNSPTFGGVLNATTESAAEAKRLAENEMRNRTILSRDGAPRRSDQVSERNQAPFNGTMAGDSEDSTMPSFEMTPHQSAPAQSNQQPAFEAADNNQYGSQTLVPPSPTGTLEEIDRQHRQPVEDAEVRDMFDLSSSQAMPTPSVPVGQASAPVDTPSSSVDAPNTPPPPPMPDFTQLPPLPTQMPDFSQVPVQMPPDAPNPEPDNLGQILPPAPPMPPQGQQQGDPGQFQIPNQQ